MVLHFRAILYGFLLSILLTVLSGFTIPFTDLGIPGLSAAVVGLLAGFVTGYVADQGLTSGAVNGAVATTLGSIISVLVLSVIGTLVVGAIGAGIFVIGVFLVVAQMVPGALGGVLGSVVRGRRER